jgi:hypothetical protein
MAYYQSNPGRPKAAQHRDGVRYNQDSPDSLTGPDNQVRSKPSTYSGVARSGSYQNSAKGRAGMGSKGKYLPPQKATRPGDDQRAGEALMKWAHAAHKRPGSPGAKAMGGKYVHEAPSLIEKTKRSNLSRHAESATELSDKREYDHPDQRGNPRAGYKR